MNDRLCLCPGLEIRAQGNGECIVVGRRGVLHGGPHTLPALSAFVVPRTMAEAVGLLEPQLSGKRAAVDLLDVIMELHHVGAIRSEREGSTFEGASRTEGYGAIPIHVEMLNDRARTSAWLEGVRRSVKPGDVVLDLGTGTGILAVAAAKAGARRVYALDATSAVDAARRMAAANGVADRVEVIRGWSTQIDLPERADLLVSELFDDDPFRERILEITADAIRRLLKPNAKMVPSGFRHRAALVAVPADALERWTFTQAGVDRWSDLHGEDFRCLLEVTGPGAMTAIAPSRAASWERLSDAVTLSEVDLKSPPELVDVEVAVAVTRAGVVTGIITWFEAEIAPGLSVTTEPGAADARTHWRNILLCVAKPRRVAPGDRVAIRYRYPGVPELELVAG